jgi:hypothetical protein
LCEIIAGATSLWEIFKLTIIININDY